jgi:hypothetical protein
MILWYEGEMLGDVRRKFTQVCAIVLVAGVQPGPRIVVSHTTRLTSQNTRCSWSFFPEFYSNVCGNMIHPEILGIYPYAFGDPCLNAKSAHICHADIRKRR